MFHLSITDYFKLYKSKSLPNLDYNKKSPVKTGLLIIGLQIIVLQFV